MKLKRPIEQNVKKIPKIIKLKRKLPVQYCERVAPGVLPAPLLCTWVGEMYLCCKRCQRKINYTAWKSGWYKPIEEELKNGTFDPKNY